MGAGNLRRVAGVVHLDLISAVERVGVGVGAALRCLRTRASGVAPRRRRFSLPLESLVFGVCLRPERLARRPSACTRVVLSLEN